MRKVCKLASILVCALMVTSAFVVVALGPASTRAVAQEPVIMTVGVTQSVDSLNPLTGYLVMAYEVYSLMYEMLVGVDEDLNPTPQIAESWDVSEDGLTWTYDIRMGMTWHDGVSVTAEDVNWTYTMMMTDEAAGSLYADYLRNVTSVRALDDYTLEMVTEVPKATMLNIVIPILPKHIWMNIPSNKLTSADMFDSTYFPDGPVGSGPFKLVDYVTDDFVKFEKYQDYWGSTVYFDELIYKIFLSPQAMLTALEAGSIDVGCSVPADSWETVLTKSNVEGQEVREISLTELGLNVCPVDLRVQGASENYELLNMSVRQAIAMAVDKAQIVEDVLLGYGEEGSVLIPTASLRWHYNVTAEEEYSFDLVEAAAVLDAAGYVDTDGDDIRENGTSGVPLEFMFEYIVDNPEDEAAATLISGWLYEIGIDAPPLGVSETTLISHWVGMKYDLFIWGWGGDADPTFLLSVMTTDQIPSSKTDWSAWSDCFYSNPYYDSLFIEQQNTIGISARQAIIYEMQRILYLDSPYVILDYPYGLYAYRTDKFTNWPDMEAHPGMTPLAAMTGGPWLYFEVVPAGDNLPPQNVYAGPDTTVALGETRSLTGYAEDEVPATLNWTWAFVEPDSTENLEYGQTVSYTFDNEGSVFVTLTVTDEGGLEAQDTLTATVEQIENAGWIAGTVSDSQDEPIVAATIITGTTSTTTDSEGTYNMTLTAGAYDVTADAEGFQASTLSAEIVAGATTTLDFTLLTSSGTLSGTVTDSETGDPIVGATVSARMGLDSKLTSTDDAGEYTIALLEVGSWDVTVTKEGYVTNTTSAVIEIGQETVLDIVMVPVDEGGGLSTLAIVIIAGIAIAAVAAIAAMLLMKSRRSGKGPDGPEEAPPPQPPT